MLRSCTAKRTHSHVLIPPCSDLENSQNVAWSPLFSKSQERQMPLLSRNRNNSIGTKSIYWIWGWRKMGRRQSWISWRKNKTQDSELGLLQYNLKHLTLIWFVYMLILSHTARIQYTSPKLTLTFFSSTIKNIVKSEVTHSI